jgi:hypothetical protein
MMLTLTHLTDRHATFHLATVHLAGVQEMALPQFDSFGKTILTILSSLFLTVLVIRMFIAWAQKKYGEMVTEIVAAIFIGWFLFAPDNAIATIKAIVTQVFG